MNTKLYQGPPSHKHIGHLRRSIVQWFEGHKRSYPWRDTQDPFKVLIAEILLRRTKADQVKPVYAKLNSLYGTCRDLSRASRDDLDNVLYPLGLRWRNPTLGHMAREIEEKYNSKVPDTRKELISLPGVGNYVAGAVLSLAYNKREWMVDTNIARLFSRYFGIRTSKEARRDKRIIDIAKMYSRTRKPRIATFAILDFTALVCSARVPKHDSCPVKNSCSFLLQRLGGTNS